MWRDADTSFMHPAVALWPDIAVFCIASLRGHSLRAGVTPGHCAPWAGSTHSFSLQRAGTEQGCLHLMKPQSGFMPCFQERYRKKAILCGKLCYGVIITGIFCHLLGKSYDRGSRSLVTVQETQMHSQP